MEEVKNKGDRLGGHGLTTSIDPDLVKEVKEMSINPDSEFEEVTTIGDSPYIGVAKIENRDDNPKAGKLYKFYLYVDVPVRFEINYYPDKYDYFKDKKLRTVKAIEEHLNNGDNILPFLALVAEKEIAHYLESEQNMRSSIKNLENLVSPTSSALLFNRVDVFGGKKDSYAAYIDFQELGKDVNFLRKFIKDTLNEHYIRKYFIDPTAAGSAKQIDKNNSALSIVDEFVDGVGGSIIRKYNYMFASKTDGPNPF